MLNAEHRTSGDKLSGARRWRLRLTIIAAIMALTSAPAWAQCVPAPPVPSDPPAPLTVSGGMVCEESDVTRSANATVLNVANGSYTGTNVILDATGQSAIVVGTNGIVSLTGGSVKASGGHAYGIDVQNSGIVSLSSGVLETYGTYGFGIKMVSGSLTASNYSITTFGDNSDGFVLEGAASVTLENLQITTHLSSSSGIEAGLGATVEGSNVTIRTGQSGADFTEGVRISDATVTLRDSDIEVVGADSVGILVNQGEFNGENIRISVDSELNTYLAAGIFVAPGGKATITGGEISTSGRETHALFADGGIIQLEGANVSATGPASSAIYLNNISPGLYGLVEVTGGSLASLQAPLILAEGGAGEVDLNGPIILSPASIAGRDMLALVTELGGFNGDLTFTLNDVTTATGDIDVIGTGNSFSGSFNSSVWTGDLMAETGNTASLSLNGSTWTGRATDVTSIVLNPTSIWNITGSSNAGTVDNAGLAAFDPAAVGFPTLTATDYIGQGGRLGLNTQLDADGSPSNLLIVDGGSASGTTGILISNAGGAGAQTTGDGIRVIQAINGGTTDADAFALGARAAAGAYEYLLFRGGGAGSDDWFLRSHLIEPAEPDVPLFRPEVPLYMSIPTLARQMGLATLGTLHERVGEQMNIVPQAVQDDYTNGVWARVLAQSGSSSWQGPMNVRAGEIGLVGLHAGMDVYRAEHEDGHRDHLGLYGAYTHQTSRIEGFALGQDQIAVGKVDLTGPAIGAYWTHYGPTGGYIDGVLQLNFFGAAGISDFGARLDTTGLGFTASLETGYPFDLGNGFELEPQGQLVYQTISVKDGRDAFSPVSIAAADALTGRLGVRLQHSLTNEETLFQPYAKANLWHGFGGTDVSTFGPSSFGNEFGDTALELGAGFTAKINETMSLYGHVDHRWSLGGQESSRSTQGALGVRVNW